MNKKSNPLINNYILIIWFSCIVILAAPIPLYVPLIFFTGVVLVVFFQAVLSVTSLILIIVNVYKIIKDFYFLKLIKLILGMILLILINFSMALYGYLEYGMSNNYNRNNSVFLIPKYDKSFKVEGEKFYVFQDDCVKNNNTFCFTSQTLVARKINFLPFIKPVEYLRKNVIDIKKENKNIVAKFKDGSQTILVY